MESTLAKLRMAKLENSNKILQVSIQTFQTEYVDLKEDQRRKVEEIEQLHLQINQSQSSLKAQHEKFTTTYTEQVERMYWYAYRRCKQKHAIIEDFDTDEDFVTEYESSALETFPLGAGRADKRVRLAATNRDETDLLECQPHRVFLC